MQTFIRLFSLCALLLLAACSSAPAVYDEADLPAAVPVQFQGWWKGKTEWDYLHLAPDGSMRLVFPDDFRGPFDERLAKPSANFFLKTIHRQGDTFFAIAKEQRYDRASQGWLPPIYSYIMFHYDFGKHELTYEQQPCNLSEDDFIRPAESHLSRLNAGNCTITEERDGQKLWKRTTAYVRF